MVGANVGVVVGEAVVFMAVGKDVGAARQVLVNVSSRVQALATERVSIYNGTWALVLAGGWSSATRTFSDRREQQLVRDNTNPHLAVGVVHM